VAEDLPYPDARFDCVLMTTTLCFLDDPMEAFAEVGRVLRPSGVLVVGFIDRDGPLGRRYEEKKDESIFYEPAQFHSATEVFALFEAAGFEALQVQQTLFSDPETMVEPEPVCEGHGDGSFVAVRGEKPA
jgi:ubiquinone/menaquinone biosynthesis C-methylase UbiE